MSEDVNFCLCTLYTFAKDKPTEVRRLTAIAMRIMLEVNRAIEQERGEQDENQNS